VAPAMVTCSWTCRTIKSKLVSRFSYANPTFEFLMSISKCIVRLKDCHGTEHSVEVYAQSLYEAVLRGLNRLQDVGWESNGNETIQRVEVEIHQEPTRHIVDVPKLLKWIDEKPTYSLELTEVHPKRSEGSAFALSS
jgi:hypothetical protein